MRNSVRCPACDSDHRSLNDWLLKCDRCGLLQSSLSPGGAPLSDGFESLRRSNFELLLDQIDQQAPLKGSRLLEVGCGRGWFLEGAAKREAIVKGIEPGADVEISRNLGFDVDQGFFPSDLSDTSPFDVIVFNDVFEHIPNPVSAIQATCDRLKPGGLAVLNLPSSDGIFYKTGSLLNLLGASAPFDRLWQRDFSSPHMSYFNPSNLVQFAERHTTLKAVSVSSLPVLERAGLRGRIHISSPGIFGDLMFCAVWLLSFALPILPQDISVVVFKKPAS